MKINIHVQNTLISIDGKTMLVSNPPNNHLNVNIIGLRALEHFEMFLERDSFGFKERVDFFFFIANDGNAIICDTDAHYVEDNPICVLQSGAFIFTMLWIEMWAVYLTWETYLHITSAAKNYDRRMYKRIYAAFTFAFCFTAVLVPYFANNLGFDPKSAIPFCLYLFSEDDRYFWFTLVTPMILFCLTGIGFSVAGAIRMQQIFVNQSYGNTIIWESPEKHRIESVDTESPERFSTMSAIFSSPSEGTSPSRQNSIVVGSYPVHSESLGESQMVT